MTPDDKFAFACAAENGHQPGMTRRDYFAAQALASGHARTTMPEYDLRAMFGERGGITREEILAADSYRIADAMISQSNKS